MYWMPTETFAHAGLGDLARGRRDVEQLRRGHVDVVALAVDLVRAVAEHRVELRPRGRDEVGVRDPRAVEAVARLALLVVGDLRQRELVDLRVAPVGMNAAMPPIACAPRRWQVLTSSSVYARMNGTVIVTSGRSGSTNSGRSRNFLMTLKM